MWETSTALSYHLEALNVSLQLLAFFFVEMLSTTMNVVDLVSCSMRYNPLCAAACNVLRLEMDLKWILSQIRDELCGISLSPSLFMENAKLLPQQEAEAETTKS